MNMLQTIVPKSDQLNADDLIARTMTIKVTDIKFKAGDDQPVSIHFEGDNGKPYKACKSMRRVLVHVWGADAKNYVGRSMTLCRDPEVMFGGQKVGGIRISHMSHIDTPVTMALTATRASRKPYTVKPLAGTQAATSVDVDLLIEEYGECATKEAFEALEVRRRAVWDSISKGDKVKVKAASDAASNRLDEPPPMPEGEFDSGESARLDAELAAREAGQ